MNMEMVHLVPLFRAKKLLSYFQNFYKEWFLGFTVFTVFRQFMKQIQNYLAKLENL